MRNVVEDLLSRTEEYRQKIDELAHQYLYHLDASAPIGGAYIVSTIQEKIANKGEKK